MAKTKETQETPETQETALRSQMWKHEDFVEWATEEGILDVDDDQPTTIAIFAAKRNLYRATDRYRTMVEDHRESAATEKAEAAAERKAKTAEAKAAEAKAPAKKATAKKAPAKRKGRAAPAEEENPFDED